MKGFSLESGFLANLLVNMLISHREQRQRSVEEQNIDFSLMLGEGSEAPVRNLSAKLSLFGFSPENHVVWLAENELHFQGRKGPFSYRL